MITNFISENAVIISATLLIVSYVFIALEKIPKVTIALLGATLTLFFGLVSQNKTNDLGDLNTNYFVNFIDFNVIFLLVSMMIIVNITSKSGVFNFIANELLKLTKGHPIAIFAVLSLFTAFMSAFLDNVTTVILIMPITFFIAKNLEINPFPFLIGEVFASNIGGTATLIGDPPNIIGSAAGFSFMDFIRVLTPVIAVILITITLVLAVIFRKDLKTSLDKRKSVINIDNSKTITDKALMLRSMFVLGLVILGFITHDITHLQTSICAMAGASILLLFEKPADILKDVEWNTIFFFIGLFIIIGGVEASGGIKLMAEWIINITQGSQEAASMLILWASGIISGIIDNIPYTATMSPMLVEIEKTLGMEYTVPLWWCLSLGACLGGNLTMIGAAANVIVSENAAKEGHKIGFLQFMKYGIVTVLISLAISSLYIYFIFLK